MECSYPKVSQAAAYKYGCRCHQCKRWNSDYHREYRKKNHKKVLEKQKEGHYRRLYGISLEERNELLIKSFNRCELCLGTWKLCVDHCHKTGKVRGILCGNCNSALEFLDEDLTRCLRLLAYLQRGKQIVDVHSQKTPRIPLTSMVVGVPDVLRPKDPILVSGVKRTRKRLKTTKLSTSTDSLTKTTRT